MYDPEDYSQLPDLFDIEAQVFPTGSNITPRLLINGTNHSNNVTVVCRDISRVAFGEAETLFTLVLEFFGKLIVCEHITLPYYTLVH